MGSFEGNSLKVMIYTIVPIRCADLIEWAGTKHSSSTDAAVSESSVSGGSQLTRLEEFIRKTGYITPVLLRLGM